MGEYRITWSGTNFNIYRGEYSVAGFLLGRVPYCCAVDEIGRQYWLEHDPRDGITPLDIPEIKGRELLQAFLSTRTGTSGTPGMSVIHFVRHAGQDKFQGYQWIPIFLEAGFQQLLPEFENHVHPGNMILQLVKVHSKP